MYNICISFFVVQPVKDVENLKIFFGRNLQMYEKSLQLIRKQKIRKGNRLIARAALTVSTAI